MKQIFNTFIFVLLVANSSYGQINVNRIEAKCGYGFYQGFNVGLNYYYRENLDIGVGLGTHFNLPPLETDNHLNILIENNLHFGKLNKQELKPWLFNQQLMYWEQGPSYDRWRILSLGLNIGRKFQIYRNIGLGIDIGPAFNLVVDVKRDPFVEPVGWMWPVLYNGRFQLYYKF